MSDKTKQPSFIDSITKTLETDSHFFKKKKFQADDDKTGGSSTSTGNPQCAPIPYEEPGTGYVFVEENHIENKSESSQMEEKIVDESTEVLENKHETTEETEEQAVVEEKVELQETLELDAEIERTAEMPELNEPAGELEERNEVSEQKEQLEQEENEESETAELEEHEEYEELEEFESAHQEHTEVEFKEKEHHAIENELEAVLIHISKKEPYSEQPLQLPYRKKKQPGKKIELEEVISSEHVENLRLEE